VSAFAGDPFDGGLPPYFAERIVVSGEIDITKDKLASMYRHLRPYGGIAFVADAEGKVSALAKRAGLENAEIEKLSSFVRITRSGALAGSAQWTHQYGDAGNSVMSHDDLVKPPFGLLWFGGAPNDEILPRHGHGPSPQVAGGRIFIEGVDLLRCLDVYTGRMLWELRIKGMGEYYNNTGHHPGANEIGSNYISLADAVYVMLVGQCLKLDPATGEIVARFSLPSPEKAAAANWGFINVSGDYLVAAISPVTVRIDKSSLASDTVVKKTFSGIVGVKDNDAYGASSKQIYVLDRHTGKVLWHKQAVYNFRHNAIVIGKDTLFCIDRMTAKKLEYLKRRGLSIDEKPVLYAWDIATGKVKWKTEKDVFGTWLGYSDEMGVLVQAGSRYRDRARDETGKGIAVYRVADGEVVWQDLTRGYDGPPILYHDQFITNGNRGEGYSLLDGKKTGWFWQRQYGCNTATGSEHLIMFRSSSASYFDLKNKGGTVNLGGFKSGCTSNMIAADGVLSVPDYTRTCRCSYQNQTSVGLVHSASSEAWAAQGKPVKGRLGINLGAEGDRLSTDDTYWVEYPLSGSAESVDAKVTVDGGRFYQHHSLVFKSHPKAWVSASGVEGASAVRVGVKDKGSYTVKLYFAEPDRQVDVAQRVFDVTVAGAKVLRNFDIVAQAEKQQRVTVIKEIKHVAVDGELKIELNPRIGKTILSGVEILKEN
jgi:outer membrane protein assembly factor BamB